MQTLVDLLLESRKKYAERPALVIQDGLRANVWNYTQLYTKAMAAAGFMRNELGIKAGERVIIQASNSPQLVACWLGAILAKIIVVPLDKYSTSNFIKQVIKKTDAKAIIFSEAPVVEAEIVMISVSSIDLGYSFKRLEEKPTPETEVVIMFTSGPTTHPKGVVLTHRNILSNVISTSQIVPHDTQWRLLSILPLSHMFEQTAGLFVPLYLGLCVFYLTSIKPPHIIKALTRYKITTLVIVPKVLSVLMQAIEKQVKEEGKWRLWLVANNLADHLPMSLRRMLFYPVHQRLGGMLDFFICGGATLEPGLQKAWERLGIKVIQGYGATECSPVIASNVYDNRIPGSVGKVMSGVEIRLSNEAEIQVKGPNVTSGYWQDESSSNAAFTSDGWYKTGDLGQYNEKGYLTILGRINDTIVLQNGLNVFPNDIEVILNDIPEVKKATVIALPPVQETVQLLAVVIMHKQHHVDENLQNHFHDIARLVNSRLTAHQQISHIHLWEGNQFPVKADGSVDRQALLADLQSPIKPTPSISRNVKKSEKTFEKVRQIISQLTEIPIEKIHPEMKLAEDFCLTSLAQVELVVALEKAFGVALDGEEFEQIGNLKDMVRLVEKGYSKHLDRRFAKWPLKTIASFFRNLLQYSLVFSIHRVFASPFAVSGYSNLDDLDLPALFIANHCSHMDTLSIIRAMPQGIRKKTAIAAAADYFFKNRFIGFSVTLLLNTFPFSRKKEIRASLEYCGELADAGWSILIYPEGTRSTTGKLQPFKSGIGVLAAELQVPVVPIAVHGGFNILPKGRKFPKIAPVRVTFGKPILVDKGLKVDEVVTMLQESLAKLLDEARET